MKKSRKISAIILSMVMMLSLLPTSVGASEWDWDGSYNEISYSGTYYVSGFKEADGYLHPFKISAQDVEIVFDEDVTIDMSEYWGVAIEVTDIDTNFIINDGVTVTLKSGSGGSEGGIQADTFTISCEHSGEKNHYCTEKCGTLYAYGGEDGAGIVGYHVTIRGGNIFAYGSERKPGIGGETIIISGGNVTAYSGFYSPAIDSGNGNVYIRGGNIEAYGLKRFDEISHIGYNYINAFSNNVYFEPKEGEYIACESYGVTFENVPDEVETKPWLAFDSEITSYTTYDNVDFAATGTSIYDFMPSYLQKGHYSVFKCKTIESIIAQNIDGSITIDRYIEPTEDNRFVISKAGNYLVENASKTYSTDYGIDVTAQSGEVNITLNGVNIDVSDKESVAAFNITGDCTTNIIINDGTENILKSGIYAAGLQNGTNPLNISCSNTDTNHICNDLCGMLTATGGKNSAGIGGGAEQDGGNITINMSKVTATGDAYAAGIGGGTAANGENITISGGIVTANGGNLASALGGGLGGITSNISILPNTTAPIYAKAGASAADTALEGSPFGSKTDITSQISGTRYFASSYPNASLSFETNGGTINERVPATYLYGYDTALPTDVTKKHNIFDGWYDNEELSGEAVTKISADETGDKIYYAKWKEVSADVSFETNGGTIVGNVINKYDYGVETPLPTDVTKSNAAFLGWYNNAELTGEAVTEIKEHETGDKTYYAKWIEDLDVNENGYHAIFTKEGLAGFSELVNSGQTDINGVLIADIDMSGAEFAPIGNAENKFSGIFDGNGHTITNFGLNITRKNVYGLFGYVDGGTVKNLSVSGNVTARFATDSGADFEYGVIGNASNDAVIENVHSTVNLTLSEDKTSTNENDIDRIGGIVGTVSEGKATIERCSFGGIIDLCNSGVYTTGGIAGYIIGESESVVKDCSFYGTITTEYDRARQVGGVVAYHNGQNLTFKNNLSVGTITTPNDTTEKASLIGVLKNHHNTEALVTNNYISENSIKPYGAYADEAYYMPDDVADATYTRASKTQLVGGEVAYRLGEAWGQVIGKDTFPVPGGEAFDFSEFEILYYNPNERKSEITVKIPESGEYTVIFADYDENGRLNMLDKVTQSLERGIITVKSLEDIKLSEGDKIMLWDSMNSLKPKCEAFSITGLEYMSGDNASSGESANNLFDGNANTKWCTNLNINPSGPTVIFKYGYPVCIESYTLTTANDTATFSGRNWTAWTLYGSDSENGEWAEIHKVEGANLPSANCVESERFVIENNTASYQYYKLVVNAIVSGNIQQMSELTVTVK